MKTKKTKRGAIAPAAQVRCYQRLPGVKQMPPYDCELGKILNGSRVEVIYKGQVFAVHAAACSGIEA